MSEFLGPLWPEKKIKNCIWRRSSAARNQGCFGRGESGSYEVQQFHASNINALLLTIQIFQTFQRSNRPAHEPHSE